MEVFDTTPQKELPSIHPKGVSHLVDSIRVKLGLLTSQEFEARLFSNGALEINPEDKRWKEYQLLKAAQVDPPITICWGDVTLLVGLAPEAHALYNEMRWVEKYARRVPRHWSPEYGICEIAGDLGEAQRLRVQLRPDLVEASVSYPGRIVAYYVGLSQVLDERQISRVIRGQPWMWQLQIRGAQQELRKRNKLPSIPFPEIS